MALLWLQIFRICFCVIVIFASGSDGLTINGSTNVIRNFDEKVRTFCEYFRQIETLLTKAEISGDPSEVAWVYGYLSAMFYNGDDKVKLIIEAYMKGEMETDHSRSIFNCLESFTKKLSLNVYVSNLQGIDPNLKNEYLTATEDLRSIMESGVAFSFHMYTKNDPEKLSERFLQIYKTRVSLSDPINKLFALLSNMNCSLNQCFLSQALIWSECDSRITKFTETVSFLNSVQRYLISGLFVEDLHLTLNWKEINSSRQLKKYRDQVSIHRDQYRDISYLLMDGTKTCYTSLNKLQQRNFYNLAYRKSAKMVTSPPLLLTPALYIITLTSILDYA